MHEYINMCMCLGMVMRTCVYVQLPVDATEQQPVSSPTENSCLPIAEFTKDGRASQGKLAPGICMFQPYQYWDYRSFKNRC